MALTRSLTSLVSITLSTLYVFTAERPSNESFEKSGVFVNIHLCEKKIVFETNRFLFFRVICFKIIHASSFEILKFRSTFSHTLRSRFVQKDSLLTFETKQNEDTDVHDNLVDSPTSGDKFILGVWLSQRKLDLFK